MTAVATNEMQEVLEALGVQGVNPGTSTGSKWYESSDKVYDSYSPVDGQLIGGVKETTKEESYTLSEDSYHGNVFI